MVQDGVCYAGTRSSKVAYLGGSGRVVTTGFSRHSDRQVSIWSDDNLSTPLHEETIDSSSGVIFPYFDQDINILYLAGKVSIPLSILVAKVPLFCCNKNIVGFLEIFYLVCLLKLECCTSFLLS